MVMTYRKQYGYTQATLAEMMGVRQQTISEWENGIHEPSRMAKKLLTMNAITDHFVYKPPEATHEVSNAHEDA